jgi:hypothetical protein
MILVGHDEDGTTRALQLAAFSAGVVYAFGLPTSHDASNALLGQLEPKRRNRSAVKKKQSK